MGDLLDERFYADLERDQARAGHDVDAGAAADDEHDGARIARRRPRARSPTRSTPTRCAATCCRSSPTGVPTGRRTRTPPATRCTSTTCGRPRASPTATRPRCSPSCCRPARSTAVTAPGWTWSATPPRSIDKLKFVAKPVDRLERRCSTTCAVRPACATSWSPAATSRTCRGRGSRRSSTSCSRSRTSATSGWPPRR